jgi:glyoxylase-like metal-dependent hydrolase (beta-lactamase superfamily II)
MFFRQLFDPESSTFTYLVGDADREEVLVIDPVLERVDEILAAAAGLALHYALDTHVHADHISAGSVLREKTGCKVVMPAMASDCGCADLTLRDDGTLSLGAIHLLALATPGHTADSMSFVVPALGVFTGDTLLVGTCGRTDFQGGNAGQLYDSVHRRLFALPDDTVVFPGHDYRGFTSTTIGEEKRSNARLAGRSRAEFIALMASLGLPPPRKIDEAVPANRNCGRPPHAA